MEPCGKRVFTKSEAALALKSIQHKGRQHSREKRYYYCAGCNGWHLTSKEYNVTPPEPAPLVHMDRWKVLMMESDTDSTASA